jgi:hypothetical protein
MDDQDNSEMPELADDALAERLAKLSQRPIDTSRLEPRVKAIVGPVPSPQPVPCWMTRRRAAAGLLIALPLIGSLLLLWSRPILASPAALSHIHEENVAGAPHAEVVDSISAADRAIKRRWPNCPRLPELTSGKVMSCHVHEIRCKRLSCLCLQIDGQSVTMAVAHPSDMLLPDAPFVTRDGLRYFVQSHGNTNFVIADRNGVWLCLIAALPSERLVETAATLRFGSVHEHG